VHGGIVSLGNEKKNHCKTAREHCSLPSLLSLRRMTSRVRVSGLWGWGAILSRPARGLSARHDSLSSSVLLRGCSCVAVCCNVPQSVAVCCVAVIRHD